MDVRAVLVMLAVLMPLLQASGQTVNVNLNIGGNTGGTGTADKDAAVIAELLKQSERLHRDPATGTWQSQLDILDMSDTGRNMVTALLLEQNKKMHEQITELQEQITELQESDKKTQQQIKDVPDLKSQVKNLTLDLCLTKRTCCNKTEACPCGYERFSERPDMCYKFSTDEKNHTDAKSACQADGAHLAMPKDKATNDFLLKQVKAYFVWNLFVWIGLTDEVTEGIWVWEDGTTLGSWDNWAQGRPYPNDRVLNCAMLHDSDVWFDFDCSSDSHYICEVKATAAP
ncbi:Collectin-11 [Branchiostoma belcheri]|nr:Collectin-11 [Branchiostoma belcheri]